MKLEKTCKCINDLNILPKEDSIIKRSLNFQKGHEYQVDIHFEYNERYKVYINGGWYAFTYLDENEFKKYFELIK